MVYTLRFFPLQNAVCFIILTYLVPVLFSFYIQGVLKLKKNNSCAKRLIRFEESTVSFEIFKAIHKIQPKISKCAPKSVTTTRPALTEERRLWVFENRVLKRIFEPRRDEVTGEWNKLHNVELNLLGPELFFF